MGRCVLLQSVRAGLAFQYLSRPGPLSVARSLMGEGGCFRAPHHTCSVSAMLGELCIAAGPASVLYLDGAQSFSGQAMRQVVHYWSNMRQHRPTLVMHLETGMQGSDGAWRPLPSMEGRYEFIMGVVPVVDDHIIFEEG